MKFTNFASIRESVKERMYESPLDPVIGQPTYTTLENLVAQFAICTASVRINTGDQAAWAGGDYGCLPLALLAPELSRATGGAISSNALLPLPDDINKEITDKTTPTDILRLTKKQETSWIAYHTQEAAKEIGVNLLVGAVEEQYIVELRQDYVGYKNRSPRDIIDHLGKTWVKITNSDKVAAKEAFTFDWADTPDMHIREYARQLEKVQRRLQGMHIPCDDEAMVIQYVDQMNRSGIFKESELLEWDNTTSLQDWAETTKFFAGIWIDRMAYRRQQGEDRPFDSALALSPRTGSGGTVGGLSNQRTMRDEDLETLAAALDRAHDEVATLQDELDASTVTSPPAEIVAAATTTDSAASLIAQLTVQGTAQTAQINQLISALQRNGGGGGGDDRDRDPGRGRGRGRRRRREGTGGDATPNPNLNFCKNCERTVAHKPADCYQLKSNASKRPAWWTQEKHGR